MSKVRNFAKLAPNIEFSEFDFYDLYRSTIEKSELGRMKKLLADGWVLLNDAGIEIYYDHAVQVSRILKEHRK